MANHPGKVPHTDDDAIDSAYHKYLRKHPKQPWDFGDYNDMGLHDPVDVFALSALIDLLDAFLEVQPFARYLPAQPTARLIKIIKGDTSLNASGTIRSGGVPHQNFASLVSRRIICIFYHFLRVAPFPDDYAVLNNGSNKGGGAQAHQDFDRICCLYNQAAAGLPRRKRKLEKQVSTCSAGSATDQGFASVFGLVPYGDQSFAKAFGIVPQAATGSHADGGDGDCSEDPDDGGDDLDEISRSAAASTSVVLPPQKGGIYKMIKKNKRAQKCVTFECRAFGWCKIHKCSKKAHICFYDEHGRTNKWPLLTNVAEPHSAKIIDAIHQKLLKCGDAVTKEQVDDWRAPLRSKLTGLGSVLRKPAAKSVMKKPASRLAPVESDDDSSEPAENADDPSSHSMASHCSSTAWYSDDSGV